MCRNNNLFCFESIFKLTILIFVFLYSLVPLSDPDMFFHIKNGEHIFYNWIPQFDPYTIHNELKYIQHEWLSDLIFYGIYSIGGFKLLWWFKILMAFIIFGILYFVMYNVNNRNLLLSFIISGLTVVFLNSFIAIRPQIFSYIIFLLEIFILERYDQAKQTKLLWILPILSITLINIHGATSPIFFAILLVYIITNLYKLEFKQHYIKIVKVSGNNANIKNLVFFSLMSMAGMVINPNGILTLTYPFKALGNNSLFQNISELKPLNIITNFGFTMFILFCVVVITMIATRVEFTLRQFTFIFSLMSLTLASKRFSAYFVLIGAVFFAQYLSRIFTNDFLNNNKNCLKLFKSVNIVGNILFIFVFCVPIVVDGVNTNALSLEHYPVGAVQILQKEKDLRLYNEFDCGHFLIFNNIKVFIDGRAEIFTKKFNNVDILEDYFKLYYGKVYPKNYIDKYKFNYFLVYKDMPMSVFLEHDEKYEKLYEDKEYALFKGK